MKIFIEQLADKNLYLLKKKNKLGQYLLSSSHMIIGDFFRF